MRDEVDTETLIRCIEADKAYVYEEYKEIKTEKDIMDFYYATGDLHDGRIARIDHDREKDFLNVYFTDTWGCDVEIIFCGDTEYHPGCLDPEEYEDCWWTECTILICDGYIYLSSISMNNPSELDEYSDFFRAKRMKYRIIPK